MQRYVAFAYILVIFKCVKSAPLRLTIDCPAELRSSLDTRYNTKQRPSSVESSEIESFCDLISNALPKAVEDGRFVLVEDRSPDQNPFSNSMAPISVPPPKSFIPTFTQLRAPKLRIPTLKVPTLTPNGRSLLAPKVGPGKAFFKPRVAEEETSAERMEKFKKGVQKMLRVVKVLGQVDQYLSERTRIIVDKLSKTFAE